MTNIYFLDVSLDGYSEEEKYQILEKTFPFLREERKEKIAKIRFLEDKLCSAGAGVLLNIGLQKYGLHSRNIVMEYRGNQKPYLKGYPEICFNLSHSGTMVMAAFSDHEVGCDIEKIGKGSLGMVRRFFHPEEQKALEQRALISSPEDWAEEFCRYWTWKESFMKVTGEGSRLSLDQFCVCPGNAICVWMNGNKMPYDIREFRVPGYCASVCVEEAAGEVFFSFQNLQDVV